MNRLVIFEMRKLANTRSSVIAFSICLLTSAVLGGVGLAVRSGTGSIDLSQMAAGVVLPFAIVAPILGVLAAASDWSTGSIQHTLLLEPRRERVFLAKACAAVLSSVLTSGLAILISLTVGVAVTAIWNQQFHLGSVAEMVWGVTAIVIPSSLLGFGVGSMLLSTPLAVATVLTVELVIDVALSLLPDGIGSYFQSATLQNWLTSGSDPLAATSSFAIWLVLPISLGLARYLTHEASS